MATSIATGALKPRVAVGMSAILNLVGAFRAVAGVCGFLCIAAVAIGIYAMVNKPKSSSSKSTGKTKVAMVAGPARRTGW